MVMKATMLALCLSISLANPLMAPKMFGNSGLSYPSQKETSKNDYDLQSGKSSLSREKIGSDGNGKSQLSSNNRLDSSPWSEKGKDNDFDGDNKHVPFRPLQVMCEVNGFIIPAIVDTGAEITVMSASCAQRCRISNMIDARYAGKAIGIGSSDILGRVNNLEMRIGPVSFKSKICILREAQVDFLIGIDFLRRFDCELSFKDNMLRMEVRGKRFRVPLANNPDFLDVQSGMGSSWKDNMNEGDVSYSEDESYTTSDSEMSYSTDYGKHGGASKTTSTLPLSKDNLSSTSSSSSSSSSLASSSHTSYSSERNNKEQDEGDFDSPSYAGISMEGV